MTRKSKERADKTLNRKVAMDRKKLLKELKSLPFRTPTISERPFDTIAAVRERLEVCAAQESLIQLSDKIKDEFKDVFRPLMSCLTQFTAGLSLSMLRRLLQLIVTPRQGSIKRPLIQQHLDAGGLRLSNSTHASPAFLVPKLDADVLPRWVNDYRQLNANTVTDSFPVPLVDDILADAAQGKIWSMTDSFYQMKVHPNDVHLTAVTTPLGLYEWLVMLKGMKNTLLYINVGWWQLYVYTLQNSATFILTTLLCEIQLKNTQNICVL